MLKKQKPIGLVIGKEVAEESKVFEKKFEGDDKITEIMKKTTKSSNQSGYLSFPRLMDQMKRRALSLKKN